MMRVFAITAADTAFVDCFKWLTGSKYLYLAAVPTHGWLLSVLGLGRDPHEPSLSLWSCCRSWMLRTSPQLRDQNGGGPRSSIAPVWFAASRTRSKSMGAAGSPSAAGSLAIR